MQTLDVIQPKVQWCSVPLNRTEFESDYQPQPNTWVQLLELLNPFCHDEALLLCQESDSEWVVWIPDHGEAVLHVSQFCVNR